MEISVVALDRRGNPVVGLTAEDFSLRDGRAEEQLAVFQAQELSFEPPEFAPLGMITNRYERLGAPSGAVSVILLDGLNTKIEDVIFARDHITKFLKQLRPEDRVAIATLAWSSLRVIHEFINDASDLLRALDRARSPTGAEISASTPEVTADFGTAGIDGLDQWIQDSRDRTGDFFANERRRRTLLALESIAGNLTRIPGRKNLLWITAGVPIRIGREIFDAELQRAARALSDAAVAVYPVDARGLVGPFDPALVGLPQPPGSRATLIGPGAAVRNAPNTMGLSYTQDAMVLLAQATGGRHFINDNDLASAIREAIDESRVSYTLGYYPTHGKWDGSYREIQVRVKRPGVTIRHRRGYYAFPDPPATPETIEEAMLAAAVSPLDATAIGLTAQMTPQEGAAGQRVTLTIEPEDVPLRLEEGRRRATLDVWYVLLDAEGAPHSIAKHPLEIALEEAGWRAAQATGIREERYMEFPAAARALRIVVRDRATGTLGSLRMPLPQE